MDDLFQEKIILLGGKTLLLDTNKDNILGKFEKGVFILDFNRKFEEEDLSVLPVIFVPYSTYQDRYLIKKYNVVLGELSDLCLK